MLFLEICEESNFLSVILYIKNIINIIKIVVPIILILMCTIDLAKKVFNDEEKSTKAIVSRFIAAVTIFFLPSILNLVLELADQSKFTETLCWKNANKETIALMAQREKKEEEERQKTQVTQKKEEEEQKKEEKEAEEVIEKAEDQKPSNNLLHENGTDGAIKVVDGVFYKPSSNNSGKPESRGSGPYGYVSFFYNRLKALIDAAEKNGYKIKMSTSEYGAWRPYAKQEYYWNCYQTKSCNNGNTAAKPGTSDHGWGIASDLSFGSKEAMYWAHDHASEFGLKFPLCKDVRSSNKKACDENWHIEPSNVKKMK